MTTQPLLQVRGLEKKFPIRGGLLQRPVGWVKAVDDLSFDLNRGEVLGLVGESGSGKTTAGRSILRLIEPTSGSIRFDGEEVTGLPPAKMRALRRRMQIVFQDPYASLDPRQRVRDVIGEALTIHNIGTKADRRDRIAALLQKVGLTADAMDRFPHEFSGGQRQRIGIARALAVEPDFIVADEPVSALDVSVQAQVVNLLGDLQRELGLAVLFIAHDLAVVRYISDRVAVMYLGRLMELAPSDSLYDRPRHPYTRALLSAAPEPDPDAPKQRMLLEGDVPSPMNPPTGCVFRTRCPFALPACAEPAARIPREIAPGHVVSCIRDDVIAG
ncbi:ABC transporter ATP-binding protein [Azospirillum rugosum]|uniref:Oligopeptide/dipeptide ABC transporter ATP-binding protein n=1 Tax=Azospirillum rugosum TaxID=416170 RepID=A0ABS4SWJ0_9PROT|nr:oligopeptide/dipeptide ABC transporter ATP-binding protein [Azospirillum rugosum]MBP2296438.1 oligopeptide/dipeptide ABC transporter ATP-binding protein [Azospirillum rugosum]MDQ0529959.1 oligopeptide/dipeptide ABC transporter ATP-binding protein [Azospirillum rugosum]